MIQATFTHPARVRPLLSLQQQQNVASISRVGILCLLLFFCISLGGHHVEAIPLSQQQMLQSLYTSTNGVHWFVQDGWNNFQNFSRICASSDPLQIYGLVCDFSDLANPILTQINLPGNNLVGVIPDGFFAALPDVTHVQFQNNPNLTGTLPSIPWPVSKVSQYWFFGCGFNGTIPDSIFVPSVVNMNLNSNRLTGTLSDAVSNATSLQVIDVGSNLLKIGTVTSSILQCVGLVELHLYNSHVTSLPENITHMPSLTVLDLGDNDLSGSIPSAWCSMALTQLSVPGNVRLTGTIPACAANWLNLQVLNIGGSGMSGSLPSFVFNFTKLTQLGMVGKFSGTIPDMFHAFPHLQTLQMGGAGPKSLAFQGAFPASILKLPSLQTLSFQYTNLKSNGTLDLSTLPFTISTLQLIGNSGLAVLFPGFLFSYGYWGQPGATRELQLSDMKQLTGIVPANNTPLFNFSSSKGSFTFANTAITGYIPNATLTWLPPASQLNAFANCPNLLYPIQPWMATLTGKQTGLRYTIGGITGQSQFSMSGGELLTMKVGNYIDIPNAFACAFCISTNTTACQSDVNAMSAPERAANFAFQPSTMVSAGVLTCTTPRVAVNLGIPVYLFYVAPAYGSETEYYQVSTNYVTASFYNPKPLFASLEPDHGRIEGCTTVTALGSGFRNAPNMTLLLQNSVYGQYIWATSGVVVNDTAVTFVIPAANASLPNAKYAMPSNGSLAVSLYAAGNVNLPANGTTEYSFATTCDTPLVLCEGNFHDDEGCPTQLCRCFSEGICALNGTEYQCECEGGFTGSGCAQCRAGFFGSDCTACDCDHGTCDDGMSGSGNCACESAWLGKSCSISKWGLGFGIVFGLAAIAIAGFFIRRRLKQKTEDGEYESLNPLK